MFHMKEAKLAGSASVLVLLFSGMVACAGVLGNPLTDDVATLALLERNIPNDYRIPAQYIPKEAGKLCWLQLNLYPLESSLKTLALKFGNLSTNRENITVFITMLQGLRFMLDNEELEATMQIFKCHYRRVRWLTGRYFRHVKDVFEAAAQTPGMFHCVPPPCPTSPLPPETPDSQRFGGQEVMLGLLILLLIPFTTILGFTLCRVLRRRQGCSAHLSCEPHYGAAGRGSGPQNQGDKERDRGNSTALQDSVV